MTPELLPDKAMGALIREQRVARGISLEDVSNETKICKHYLRAIEAGDLTELPGGMYRRAFVRQCAAAVGLSVEPHFELVAEPPAVPVLADDRRVTVIEGDTPELASARTGIERAADTLFTLAEALIPRRIGHEELGDAREFVADCGRPLWARWLKVFSALFWVGVNTVRALPGALLAAMGLGRYLGK